MKKHGDLEWEIKIVRTHLLGESPEMPLARVSKKNKGAGANGKSSHLGWKKSKEKKKFAIDFLLSYGFTDKRLKKSEK